MGFVYKSDIGQYTIIMNDRYSTWTSASVMAARRNIWEPGPCVGVDCNTETLNPGKEESLRLSFLFLP